MHKTLVLAEKPSVARDLARVLGYSKKEKGYFEGKKYIVTWALGHLVTLADPELYEEKYKSWRIEDLPLLPSSLKLVVIKQSSKQFNVVKGQMLRKDVGSIIIATDAGREGELVARWIIEKAFVKKPIKRLWISSVTDKAISDGFNKLKDGKEYERLYASAAARAEADWLVGINATRALTCRYNAQLSCGRVQTPTLAMIVKREEEIRNFKPRVFYGITALSDSLKLIWQDSESKQFRTFDKDKCNRIFMSVNSANHRSARVVEVDKAYKKAYPPPLYNLTDLQRDAHRIFGYSVKETLSIMQRLYEEHKLLTYPRTDSRHISHDVAGTLKDRIKACGTGHNLKIASKILKNPITVNKSFVDNDKVSDHHAIIPTEEPSSRAELNDREKKIYNLVAKRFLAVLHAPFEYEQTTIRARIGDQDFLARGRIIITQGWKEIYENALQDEEGQDDISGQILPYINKGDILNISGISQTSGETRPPAPFNEGTLLSAMENPAKYMDMGNKELIKTLDEAGGIGTVATRADIIEKLFSSFLMEKRGKDIFITSKGRQLLELVPEDLKSPELTARWEQKLGLIAKGHIRKDAFINEMKRYTEQIVKEIKFSEGKFKHDNITGTQCPQCKKLMLEVKGKKGKMLVCQDRECGYRKGISKITNARCPECRKKLELYGQGEGQIFVCRCGFKEKLSMYNKRRQNEKTSISRKEVSSYLKEQEKANNRMTNPALAEALAKLKNK